MASGRSTSVTVSRIGHAVVGQQRHAGPERRRPHRAPRCGSPRCSRSSASRRRGRASTSDATTSGRANAAEISCTASCPVGRRRGRGPHRLDVLDRRRPGVVGNRIRCRCGSANAAFFRENTCTAVLYVASVVQPVCRRIANSSSSVGTSAIEPIAPPRPPAMNRELSNA